MSKFNEFLKKKNENSINDNSKYASDPNWQDVWFDLLNYYSGNIEMAENAINNAIKLHGSNAKSQILRLVASIRATGQSQRYSDGWVDKYFIKQRIF